MKQAGGFHKQRGTSGPMVQSNPVGRPSRGIDVPQTPVPESARQEQPHEVPAEHRTMMQQYAQALSAYERLKNMAEAADAGPWVKYYAEVARQQVEEVAVRLKDNTPSFI